MSDDIKQLLDEILKSNPADKVKLACESLETFHSNLKRDGVSGETISKIILNLTRFFVSADSKCTSYEYSFFQAVTHIDLSEDKFYELTNGGRDPSFVKDTLEFLNGLDEETRNAAITYGIAVLSSDLNYSEAEVELIDRMLKLDGESEPELDDENKAIFEKSMEITEEILKTCVILGNEEETSNKIGKKISELSDSAKSLFDAKAVYLAVKKLEELTFEQIEELHKVVSDDEWN